MFHWGSTQGARWVEGGLHLLLKFYERACLESIFHSLLMRIFGVSMVIYFKDCLYVHTVYVKYVFIKD